MNASGELTDAVAEFLFNVFEAVVVEIYVSPLDGAVS